MSDGSFLRALERLSRSCEAESAGEYTGGVDRSGSEEPGEGGDGQGNESHAGETGQTLSDGEDEAGLGGLLAQALLEARLGRMVVAEEFADRLVELFLAGNVPREVAGSGSGSVSSPELPNGTCIRGVL